MMVSDCKKSTWVFPSYLANGQVSTLVFDGTVQREAAGRGRMSAQCYIVVREVNRRLPPVLHKIRALERVPQTGVVVDPEGIEVASQSSRD